jgi:hypothetical protein
MKSVPIRQMLQGGDRRSIGDSNVVVGRVLRNPDRFPELIECLWGDERIVRMRAADAVEKVCAQKPGLLRTFKAELLGLADEATQAELRWHLAQILPRLPLRRAERVRVVVRLRDYLQDRSSIVKTFALQGLAELSEGDPALEFEVTELLERACRTGTPAMKARSRKLMNQFIKK